MKGSIYCSLIASTLVISSMANAEKTTWEDVGNPSPEKIEEHVKSIKEEALQREQEWAENMKKRRQEAEQRAKAKKAKEKNV